MNGPLFGGRAWLPALAVLPMFAGFAFFGEQVGTIIGALTLTAVIVWAARQENDDPFEVAEPGANVPGGILVVVLAAIEEPRVAGVLAAIGDPSRAEAGDSGLLVLAPAQISRMDRWTGDLEAARFESQRVLAVSVATLAAAGIQAEGRVGDGDLIVAAEDALHSYAATEVVVVAAPGEREKQIETLERRLTIPFRRVS